MEMLVVTHSRVSHFDLKDLIDLLPTRIWALRATALVVERSCSTVTYINRTTSFAADCLNTGVK